MLLYFEIEEITHSENIKIHEKEDIIKSKFQKTATLVTKLSVCCNISDMFRHVSVCSDMFQFAATITFTITIAWETITKL